MCNRINVLSRLMKKYPDLGSAIHKGISLARENLTGYNSYECSHWINYKIEEALFVPYFDGQFSPEEYQIIQHYQRLLVNKIGGKIK